MPVITIYLRLRWLSECLARRATLAWLVGLLSVAECALGQVWTETSAPTTNWAALACSADGGKLVAAVDGGGIYVSQDFGATWTQTGAPITNWSSLASSADGTKLFASV